MAASPASSSTTDIRHLGGACILAPWLFLARAEYYGLDEIYWSSLPTPARQPWIDMALEILAALPLTPSETTPRPVVITGLRGKVIGAIGERLDDVLDPRD